MRRSCGSEATSWHAATIDTMGPSDFLAGVIGSALFFAIQARREAKA